MSTFSVPRVMFEARTISVSIARPVEVVYDFVVNPANLPSWARGLCRAVRREGSRWLVETDAGAMSIEFVERNRHGVLDHRVRTSSGQEFFNPMRVVPNGEGSELLFTVYRFEGVSSEQFERDVGLVEADLKALKALLERP